jgi:hypothetical protein
MMTPLWRKTFDAFERPLAAASEAWIQSDTFMDLTAATFRVQRRMLTELQQVAERWLHLWGLVSRGDVMRLANQVGSLERQVRDLQRATEHRERAVVDGRQPGGDLPAQPRTGETTNRSAD